MFQVICEIMAHLYEMENNVIMAYNFCIAKKMNCVLDDYHKQSSWNKMSYFVVTIGTMYCYV